MPCPAMGWVTSHRVVFRTRSWQIRQLLRVGQTGQWRAYVMGLDEIGEVR